MSGPEGTYAMLLLGAPAGYLRTGKQRSDQVPSAIHACRVCGRKAITAPHHDVYTPYASTARLCNDCTTATHTSYAPTLHEVLPDEQQGASRDGGRHAGTTHAVLDACGVAAQPAHGGRRLFVRLHIQ